MYCGSAGATIRCCLNALFNSCSPVGRGEIEANSRSIVYIDWHAGRTFWCDTVMPGLCRNTEENYQLQIGSHGYGLNLISRSGVKPDKFYQKCNIDFTS